MRPSDAVIILAGMAVILAIYSTNRVQAQESCMPVSAAVEAAEASTPPSRNRMAM